MNTNNMYYCTRTKTVETTILTTEGGQPLPSVTTGPTHQGSSAVPPRVQTKPVMRPRPKPRMPPPVTTPPLPELPISKVQHYKSTVTESVLMKSVVVTPTGADTTHRRETVPTSTPKSNDTASGRAVPKVAVEVNTRESAEAPTTTGGGPRRLTSVVMYRMSAPNAGKLASCFRKLDLVSESAGSALCKMSQCVCSVIATLRDSYQTTYVDEDALSKWKCSCKARAMVKIHDYEKAKVPSVKYEIEVVVSCSNEAMLCVYARTPASGASKAKGSTSNPELHLSKSESADVEARTGGKTGQVVLQKRAALPWEVPPDEAPSSTSAVVSIAQRPVAESSLVLSPRKTLGQLTFI